MASPFILCLMAWYLAHITFVHGELLQLQGMSKELGLLSSKRQSYKIDILQILSFFQLF